MRAVYRELLREGTDSIDDWDASRRRRQPGACRARAAAPCRRHPARRQHPAADRRTGRLRRAGAAQGERVRARDPGHGVRDLAQLPPRAHRRLLRRAGRGADVPRVRQLPRSATAAPSRRVDPVDVAAALACIARFDNHLGGVRIASILRGATDAWTASRAWVTELPFFGALRTWDVDRIRDLLERLVELDCVARGHGEKPTLGITERGSRGAERRHRDRGRRPRDADALSNSGTQELGERPPLRTLTPEISARFEALRRWRSGGGPQQRGAAVCRVPRQDAGRDRAPQPASSASLVSIRRRGSGQARALRPDRCCALRAAAES